MGKWKEKRRKRKLKKADMLYSKGTKLSSEGKKRRGSRKIRRAERIYHKFNARHQCTIHDGDAYGC